LTDLLLNITSKNGSWMKPKKVQIMRALEVGNAWLFEAEKAVDIVQKYGKGGVCPSQPVIDKITSTDGLPEGSTQLLAWLKDWETKHPM